MGVHILEGKINGDEDGACFVDSVTGTAFGPLMSDYEEADGFLDVLTSLNLDPREMEPDALAGSLAEYRKAMERGRALLLDIPDAEHNALGTLAVIVDKARGLDGDERDAAYAAIATLQKRCEAKS